VSLAVFDGFSFETFAGTLFLFAGIAGACWRLTKATVPEPDEIPEADPRR
jgi:hypothetical protein